MSMKLSSPRKEISTISWSKLS